MGELVVSGGALVAGTLLTAWFARSRPLLARFMLAVSTAAIVPIAIAFVTEDASSGYRVSRLYASSLRAACSAVS